jgi:DNA-binding transcriptional ArsR family regulator
MIWPLQATLSGVLAFDPVQYLRMYEDAQSCEFGPDSEYVDLAAEVFSLLSDPTRIRIVLVLRQGECAVGDLAQQVGKPPTAVSQHLAKLRWGRIVAARHEGNRAVYRLIDGHARMLVQQAVFQAEHAVDDQPRHHGRSHPAAEDLTAQVADNGGMQW